MSNFTDFISGGGGGGANTYTPSTATAGIDVVAGSAYKLSNSGTLLAFDDAVQEEVAGVLADFVTSSESNYQQQLETLTGDVFLPDGSKLVWYGRQGYDLRVTLTKDGTSRFSSDYAAVVGSGFNWAGYVIQKNIGQTSTHYLVAYRLNYYASNGQYKSQAGIIKVNKSDGTLSHHIFHANLYIAFANAGYGYINAGHSRKFGNQHTCRGGTVFVDAFNTSTSGVAVGSQVLDSSGSPTGSAGRYTFSTHDDDYNGYLIKIDDANGIFLFFHSTNSSTMVVSKVVIAADAARTVTTLYTYTQYSGMASDINRENGVIYGGGTGSNNLFATFSSNSSYFDSQVGTYDPSDDSITWSSANRKYYSIATYNRNNTHWQEYKTQRAYNPDDKLFYMSGDFSSGEGFIYNPIANTLVAAPLKSKVNDSNNERFQIAYSGGVLHFCDKNDPFNGSAWYATSFDSSLLKTQDAVAVALASGSAGSTVNIALKDGITSSSTLPSTHYLSKSDLYFPYAVEGVSATSVIKSIQRGITAFSSPAQQTVSISAVDVNKSMVVVNGWGYHGASNTGGYGTTFLTNGTTLTFNTNTSSYTKRFSWQVIEYV